MVFAALPTLQKNSLSTTTTSDMTTGSLEVEVTEQAVFYRAGVLLTNGWELGPDNAVEFRTEEVIVTSTDGTSGPGTVFFSTRAVKADGTNGPAYAWPAGTRIRNTFSTAVYDQIRDNFDSHQTIIAAMPNKNILINPGFTVNQRVYVSGTDLGAGSAGNGYAHDRWRAGTAAINTYTFTQLVSPTQITITAGTLIQTVENRNVEGGNYVLSWTGTAQARVGYGSSVAASLPSGAYAASPIVISNIPAGDYVTVEYNTGTLYEPQLESGTVPTRFEFRPYGYESQLCMRYYFRTSSPNGIGVVFMDTNIGRCHVGIFTAFRTSPTLFANNVGVFDGGNTATISSITASYSTPNSIEFDAALSAPLTSGRTGLLYYVNSTTYFSAESEL